MQRRAGGGPFSSLGADGANLHRNKRSVAVDLTTDAGRAVFFRLVEQADVVVENFRPDVKAPPAASIPTRVWAVNPRVVYASISGFGQDGPYATRPGVDQIAQGLGGLMSVTGPPGSGPWRVGIAISDTAAGTLLTQGVLAALIARDRTGRGQWVHTSLLEAMVSFMDFQAARWLIDGEVPQQEGNQHPTMVPMGAYPTADGHLNVSALRDFRAFCELLGAPELADDPRYVDFASRHVHRGRARRRPRAHPADAHHRRVGRAQLAEHVPCGPVLRGRRGVRRSAGAAPAADAYRSRTRPGATSTCCARRSRSATRRRRCGRGLRPTASTRRCSRELGYSDDEIDDLHTSGAVGAGSGRDR